VPEFQRTIDYIVRENDLKGCYPYLDDITMAGANQVEHDRNLQTFYVAASKANLNINESKTQLSKSEISLLGYKVGYRSVQPDPDPIQPLLNLPYPKSAKELTRLIGLFAYYAQWISNYSAKIRPFIKASLPLDEDALRAVDVVKQDLASATLQLYNP